MRASQESPWLGVKRLNKGKFDETTCSDNASKPVRFSTRYRHREIPCLSKSKLERNTICNAVQTKIDEAELCART